jgi:hypothetical protein
MPTSDNETSSKLLHCRLGHILRGRIECLIKEDILVPLDFSKLGHCIEENMLNILKRRERHIVQVS